MQTKRKRVAREQPVGAIRTEARRGWTRSEWFRRWLEIIVRKEG